MTASDHLKHRTGSLGGDQIPEDLQQMYFYASLPEPKNDWAESCMKLIERIAKAEAALAQKTRECEELRSYIDAAETQIYEFKKSSGWGECPSPDMHASRVLQLLHDNRCTFLTQVELCKEHDNLKAQVEQLGRQIANEKFFQEQIFKALGSSTGETPWDKIAGLQRQVAEMEQDGIELNRSRNEWIERFLNLQAIKNKDICKNCGREIEHFTVNGNPSQAWRHKETCTGGCPGLLTEAEPVLASRARTK